MVKAAESKTQFFSGLAVSGREDLASKTIHNFYISLCAFFTWVQRELELPNPIKAIPALKFEEAPIEPYTKEEVEALLKASNSAVQCVNVHRDPALILVLLDTGLRASELRSEEAEAFEVVELQQRLVGELLLHIP